MKIQKILKYLVLLLISVALLGCRGTNETKQSIVFVIDMTASTDSEGRAKAFRSAQEWFEQKRLKRGDKITVIPVTGDAWTESQGRILRYQLSEKREVYDADLYQLGQDLKQGLEQMERDAMEKPYRYSDILGATRLAAEELSSEDENTRKILVILSDFLQDNTQCNFKTSPFIYNNKSAQSYAKKIAKETALDFKHCVVLLGLLRSNDLKALSPERKEALQSFWVEYFQQYGASNVSTFIDGPGQISRGLQPVKINQK